MRLALFCWLAVAAFAADDLLLVEHARIATAPGCDALLVRGPLILSLGTGEVLGRAFPGAKRVDAHGGLVLPGLLDPHVHLRDAGLAAHNAMLQTIESMPEALAVLREYAKKKPEAKWILGSGFSYGLAAKGQYPTRQQLDAVVPDRPALIESYDGHAMWANTKALAAAGVTAATADPPGGHIVREPDGKTPAGTLLETAGQLVAEAVPAIPRAERKAALAEAAAYRAAHGITALDDILTDEDEPELLVELAREGKLPVRVRACPPLTDALGPAEQLRAALKDGPVRMGFLKAFVDGVIESRTAAMLEPYAGTHESGQPLMTGEVLTRRVTAAHRAGFQVAMHAIGDRAVRMALDAVEAAQGAGAAPRAGPPHRIEHCETVAAADLPRFAKLGVIASMQPVHATPVGADPDRGAWSENLGAERLPHTFPWRDLEAAGALLAFGSDAPVAPPDPLPGLAVALTRQDAKGAPPKGWHANQCLAWPAALSAYTRGSARAMGLETVCGDLLPGLHADFVVLAPDADPAQPLTLWTAKPAHVFVDGVRVAP